MRSITASVAAEPGPGCGVTDDRAFAMPGPPFGGPLYGLTVTTVGLDKDALDGF